MEINRINGKEICDYDLYKELIDDDAKFTSDGYISWELDGKLHRLGAPAVIGPDGTQQWRRNGHLHRIDGPAVIRANGSKEYWVDGRSMTKEKFNDLYTPKKIYSFKRRLEDFFMYFQF
jgi:hypothetical protein